MHNHDGADAQIATLATVPVAGTDATLSAIQQDGTQWVAARHICDTLGINWKTQHRKLKGRPWARVALMTTHDTTGREQEMAMVDRRTLLMWLATIHTTKAAPEVRATLEAFQMEAADALDAYFHKGGAINPRADENQLNNLIQQSQLQLGLVQAAKGLVHPDHLEAKARIILARGLGEAPELDPATRPLYASDFLKDKGLSAAQVTTIAPQFGKRIKELYVLRHGRDPEKYPMTLPNGQVREVNAYTEQDRDLMGRVWEQYYAGAK